MDRVIQLEFTAYALTHTLFLSPLDLDLHALCNSMFPPLLYFPQVSPRASPSTPNGLLFVGGWGIHQISDIKECYGVIQNYVALYILTWKDNHTILLSKTKK